MLTRLSVYIAGTKFHLFILPDSPHQTNIKLIQICTSALAGTDHRDKLQ